MKKLLLTILFLIPSLSFAGLGDALVGWWPLDSRDQIWTSDTAGTVIDRSGAGNTGVFTNMTKSSSLSFGKIGQASRFDGVNDQVNMGSELIGTGDITVSVWVYPNSFGEGSVGQIMGNGRFLFFSNGAGWRVRSDGVAGANSGALTLRRWTHLTVTRTSAGITNFYFNGVLSGTANQSSGTPATGTTNLFIGNNSATTQTFDGRIDDIRIYNRILPLTEINQLYRLGFIKKLFLF